MTPGFLSPQQGMEQREIIRFVLDMIIVIENEVYMRASNDDDTIVTSSWKCIRELVQYKWKLNQLGGGRKRVTKIQAIISRVIHS